MVNIHDAWLALLAVVDHVFPVRCLPTRNLGLYFRMVEVAKGTPLMAAWTSRELRELTALHQNRRPTHKELATSLPRHSARAIGNMAQALGLRPKINRWLTITKQYIAQREIRP